MCGKTYGKVPTAWCDDLSSVQPWKDALGKREETKKGKYNNMVRRSYGRSPTWYWTDGTKGIEYRNVNSWSRLRSMICCLSDSGSCPEWYSELFCDDSSLDSYSVDSSESCSNDVDMTSIQGSGMMTGVSCLFVPQNFVLVESQIRDAVNRMGETILAQVCCLRCDQGYHQWPLLATTELWGSKC